MNLITLNPSAISSSLSQHGRFIRSNLKGCTSNQFLSCTLSGVPLLGALLVSPTNFRPCLKGLQGKYVPPKFGLFVGDEKTKFHLFAPGSNPI